MRRVALRLFLLGALACGWPAAAAARWSHPVSLAPGPASPYAAPAVAVDGRGDTAVAWESTRGRISPSRSKSCAFEEAPKRPDCFPLVTLKLAVYTANRQEITRTLWQARVNPAMRISVAIAHAEATVAWGAGDRNEESAAVRVAHGPLKGRWRAPQVLGHFNDFWFTGGKGSAYPALAVRPDGTVLAAWSACRSMKACPRPVGGVELAWRPPGRPFGAAQLVRQAPEGARPVFDAVGEGYLSSPCSGRVLMTAPGSRRFEKLVTLAGGPVSDLALGTSGAGEGLLTWVAGACSADEAVGNTPGPVMASALKHGDFGAPALLTPPGTAAFSAFSVAVPGGGVASWSVLGPGDVAVSDLRIVGAPGPFAAIPVGSRPVASDGGGDVLFTPAILLPGQPSGQFVLPRRGAALEAAPTTFGVLAAAPYARLAADAWYDSGLKLSVWRSELLP